MQHYTVYLFLENCSRCFGWYLHPSSGAHTQLYLQYPVLVKPLLLPAAIVEELELVGVWYGNCIDLFWWGCNLTSTDQYNSHTTLGTNYSTIAVGSRNGLTIIRYSKNSRVFVPDDGWRYHPKHVEQFSRNK